MCVMSLSKRTWKNTLKRCLGTKIEEDLEWTKPPGMLIEGLDTLIKIVMTYTA